MKNKTSTVKALNNYDNEAWGHGLNNYELAVNLGWLWDDNCFGYKIDINSIFVRTNSQIL